MSHLPTVLKFSSLYSLILKADGWNQGGKHFFFIMTSLSKMTSHFHVFHPFGDHTLQSGHRYS